MCFTQHLTLPSAKHVSNLASKGLTTFGLWLGFRFKKIQTASYKCPSYFTADQIEMIKQFLVVDTAGRLGMHIHKGVEKLKGLAYFSVQCSASEPPNLLALCLSPAALLACAIQQNSQNSETRHFVSF